MVSQTDTNFQAEFNNKCEHTFKLGDIILYSSESGACPKCDTTFSFYNKKIIYLGDHQRGILIAHFFKVQSLIICPNCGKITFYLDVLCTPAQIIIK